MKQFIQIRLIFISILIVSILSSCRHDHRDLHVSSSPLFVINVDWSIAQLEPDGATAMLFPRNNPIEYMFSNPYRHALYLDPASYDMIVLNEIMVSPTLSNIEGVSYRGIDKFETSEAYSKTSKTNSIFSEGSNEKMVGYGYPDPVACTSLSNREILGEKEYITKYQNGVNKYPSYSDYDADSSLFTPVLITRDVKVIAHVRNFKSGFRISGALRGFAEGVLLASRQPSGANVTYTFNLNSAVPDPENENGHIIVSPLFNTFGPWWNDSSGNRKYNLDIFASVGSEVFKYSFDVTKGDGMGFATNINETTVIKGLDEAIVKIREEEAIFVSDGEYPKMETIIIEISFELPNVSVGTDVDMNDWGEDIVIEVPIL